MCGKNKEIVSDIVSKCSKLAQREYKRRHDNVAKYAQWRFFEKNNLKSYQMARAKIRGCFGFIIIINLFNVDQLHICSKKKIYI